MKYFFTSDEHYGHTNIIKYCNRPFSDVKEMDEELIKRHNEVVGTEDMVYHLGDFTLRSKREALNYLGRLNGKHVIIRGSHDKWMYENFSVGEGIHEISELKIGDIQIVMCHYAMRVWSRSHHNSWHLFGHSHGKLEEIGKSLDVGVDTHDYYPYSFEEVEEIMKKKDDNFNNINDEKRNTILEESN